MFTVEARERLRDDLVSAAQADARISAAALVGSSALGREDEWSDIDLALCVDADAQRSAVIAEWTDWMYAEHAAVHTSTFPVARRPTGSSCASTHCRSTSFLARDEVRRPWPGLPWPIWSHGGGSAGSGIPGSQREALAPESRSRKESPAPQPVAGLIGMAWLYALHATSEHRPRAAGRVHDHRHCEITSSPSRACATTYRQSKGGASIAFYPKRPAPSIRHLFAPSPYPS